MDGGKGHVGVVSELLLARPVSEVGFVGVADVVDARAGGHGDAGHFRVVEAVALQAARSWAWLKPAAVSFSYSHCRNGVSWSCQAGS